MQILASHSLASLGGEPHVFHCHHYNCYLQKTVMEQGALVDAVTLLTEPAAELARSQAQSLGWDRVQAEDAFRVLGFGRVDLSKISAQGGVATLQSSHYGMGWLSRFGASLEPICFMPAGWVAGVAQHLFGASFRVKEVSCLAAGAKECRFELSPGGPSRPVSPGMGRLADFDARPEAALRTSVDEAAIIQACGGLPLSGDAEGTIHAFGVALSRHYANYYNLLSYRFDQAMGDAAGEAARMAARLLLTEAGRVCAFHTFGGIMESAEWEALIKPQCKTREDWIYGMVAVVNALGWGRWSVAGITPGNRLEMVVDGSYESNGYLASYGQADGPRCFLLPGAMAGLANLIYQADITQRPELTPAFYEQTFNRPGFFVAREVECRSQGDKACRIVAERL